MDDSDDDKRVIISQEVAALRTQIESAVKASSQLDEDIGRLRERLTLLDERMNEVKATSDSAIQVAQVGVTEAEDLRRRAGDALKLIEEDARKANSESGFAFNAKGNAEEHAKAIAQIRGIVESTFAGLTSTKTQTDETAQAITAARVAADAHAKAIAENKATVTLNAAQVVAASERVAAVLPSIEQGSKDANAITAAKAAVEANASAIDAFHSQAVELIAKATAEASAIAKAEDDSKKFVVSMTAARDMANAMHGKLVEYEAEIVRLTGIYVATQTKLEGLLPHATSAGLASAFHNQKERFAKPQRNG